MSIESHISDLLYRYDCVVVPGFGAFLTKRISAKIHESTHTFYPPKKVLSFNEQLQDNDGLLCSHIAEVEKLPYGIALQKISDQVKSYKSFMMQGEKLVLQNIGEMTLNPEGKLNFEPSGSINYLTDSFGLSHFTATSVVRDTHRETVEAIEQTTPISITPERRKSIRPFYKYAAVATIALVLGGVAGSAYYASQIEAHNLLAQKQANERLDAKLQEATFVIDNPLPSVTLTVDKQAGNYHIVAGAFRIEENSNKKVEQLKALGYNARNIGPNRYGLHEVVYSSYETSEDALKALRQIRREHNSQAWLMVKKLQ
ncbi:MAG TPA: SPOR domain-containing protein [Aquaticitalea sp.]|nr:SPOR domain-containing protein [Aquaticitalea sp.]